MGKPFVINRHGRLVFPSNFLADLDFSCLETEAQLDAVVRRDFESKAPTGTDILDKVESGRYRSRYHLLRDLALNLFWANRYAMTMYEKRPVRWRDVPRHRDDIFLPVLAPWKDGEKKVAAVNACYESLPSAWDVEAEDRIYDVLFDVYRHKLHHATELGAVKKTVGEALAAPDSLSYCLTEFDPDFPVFSFDEILDCAEAVPELEALHRMAMVLHNQYPWNRSGARLELTRKIKDDEFVVLFVPRNREVTDFINRVRRGRPARPRPRPVNETTRPETPVAPIVVSDSFAVPPKIESLAVAKGEQVCRNEDVIRNSAYSWSPMSAEDISSKTGIDSRLYTTRELDDISLSAADAALRGSGRSPEEIGGVIFCSCTSTRMLPSVATWLSGQLGMYQTHASFDLVAACAGFPYGISEAVRMIQNVKRPVLVVFAEKFSDKIGSVRPSRMIFGDGAAAVVLAPGEVGEEPDVEVLQTFASGPVSEVNSIIWPNPEFDNDVTVWGPEVKALVKRYLIQMMSELGDLPHPDREQGALIDAIDLVVPHQANATMVKELGAEAGLDPENMYFNIDRVGNVSAASIPIAIYDAVADGVIDRPVRVFAPGFGAGAVAGYAVLRMDPAIVVPEEPYVEPVLAASGNGSVARASSTDDVREAFG
ncbi:MAG: 3-oxoacyl-ACP synthase III family protein [Thermoleophilia bacterium]